MKSSLFYWLIVLIGVSLPILRAETVPQATRPVSPYSIRWVPDPSDTNKVLVEVSGLSSAAQQRLKRSNWEPAEWPRLLPIFVEQGELAADIGLPPMLGAYGVEGSVVRFRPQFPLTPGIKYRAVFHPGQLPGGGSDGEAVIAADFQRPRPESNATTVVSGVYPSTAVVPENLLKFYLHFSAPMSRGRSYDHIHLQDESGKDVELPFLEIDEELWDPTMTRLTLFIDPGRIKRGVQPLEEIGPALQEGKRFTLVIDRGWIDAAGNPLKESFRKAFKVGPPDREPPDPAQWRIQPPTSGTRAPLTILFPEPMDHALAQRLIRVTASSGELVEGLVTTQDEERQWVFIPSDPWRHGSFTLLIQTTIEDLAGNNIGKPFEVDTFEGVQRQLNNVTTRLLFEVR